MTEISRLLKTVKGSDFLGGDPLFWSDPDEASQNGLDDLLGRKAGFEDGMLSG